MKKKKIIISIIVCVLLVIFVGLAYVGNYFFNYALVRQEGIVTEANIDPNAPQSVETYAEVVNKEKSKEDVSKWLEEVKTEDTTILSEDGLNLWGKLYFQEEKTDKWVIIAHGYTSSHEDIQPIALNFYNKGYNVLTPDMRAHGNSEGKYIGMGWLDRKDMLLWIDYVLSLDSNSQIVLYGESMGGATVMMTSGEDLPSNVKAIIEDCGYTSVQEMFEAQLYERFGLPPFPILNAAEVVTSIRAKYNFDEASVLEQVKKSKTPMLFTHGGNDNYVPTEMVYRLYEAAQCEKDILVIDGADHGSAPDVDPDKYYEKVFSFLGKYIN
ncbi:alpha/beta fold hydrolase [Clostridium sartagoforme]|uniref:Alpha/beta fold hydrolase n=1 Tax=Clostridium sartagoforme TaxID=84031 RepID=A0A4V3RLF6_9CLOT|nr:alpha/beta fold hydrolase [Clostridium sartagoforme]TGY43460.1 alpha/beta fold hydrolase [Clostridium sartagoforme]